MKLPEVQMEKEHNISSYFPWSIFDVAINNLVVFPGMICSWFLSGFRGLNSQLFLLWNDMYLSQVPFWIIF